MFQVLDFDQVEAVSGGTSEGCNGCFDDDYWAEELLRYKTGQPNRFGEGG